MCINHKTIDAARGRRAEGMGAGGELYSPSGDSHIKSVSVFSIKRSIPLARAFVSPLKGLRHGILSYFDHRH